MNIDIIRLVTGEFVITGIKSEDDSTVYLTSPMVIVPSQNNGLGLMELAPFAGQNNDKLIKLNKNAIVYRHEPDIQIKNIYQKHTNSILTPKPGLILP